MLVKICGITNYPDAKLATELGADYLGFIFAPSPRQVTPDQVKTITSRLNPRPKIVGVFVNEKSAVINQIIQTCNLDYVQLSGDESPEDCQNLKAPIIKSFHVQTAKDIDSLLRYEKYCQAILLDTRKPGIYGGTGKTFDWSLVNIVQSKIKLPVFLAGGLTPDNIAEAIIATKPFAVDVSSGVEKSAGLKDPQKLKLFLDKAKEF